MQPTLCVLIPVYNNQAGLERTLASLAVATPAGFEIIVVDDGSNPPLRIEAFAGPHRIHAARLEQNGGITRALNHGLRTASEKQYRFIGRVDAGDTVRPHRFDLQLQLLENNPDCGLVGSQVDFVDLRGKPLFTFRAPESDRGIRRRMRAENCIIHSAVTMRADVVRAAGGYGPNCLTSEDYDLFLRMLRISDAAIVPQSLTACEYNLTGLSVARRGRQQRERLRLQLRHFQPSSWLSYYGIARTCLAMITPHSLVLFAKRGPRVTGGGIESPVVG